MEIKEMGVAEGEYGPDWRYFYRVRRLAALSVLGFPVVAILGVLVSCLTEGPAGFWMVMAWMAGSVVIWGCLATFRCPRCTTLFLGKRRPGAFSPEGPRCSYCGLQAGTPSDPGDMEQATAEVAAADAHAMRAANVMFKRAVGVLLVGGAALVWALLKR